MEEVDEFVSEGYVVMMSRFILCEEPSKLEVAGSVALKEGISPRTPAISDTRSS